jgi:SAM-dependent methyltransferase
MYHQAAEKLLKLVKDNYDDIAEAFDLDRRKPVWPETAKLASEVKPGSRVLDVGCGNGRLFNALSGKGVDYVGVDNSNNLLDKARSNYPDAKFIVGDMLSLDSLGLGRFDEVFCIATIHHLPGKANRAEGWRQLASCLKPGGRAVVSVWDFWQLPKYRWPIIISYIKSYLKISPYDPGDLIFPWKDSTGKSVSPRYYHACTHKELAGQAKAAGLKVDKIYAEGRNGWVIAHKPE